MGFSVAAAFALLMVASMIAFGTLAYIVSSDIRELNVLSKKEKKKKMDAEDTDFEISSISAQNTSSTAYNLTIVLYNTGSTTLESEKFSFLVDGSLVNSASFNSTYLYPLEYLEVKVTNLTGTVGSTHRIKIVSENGVARYAEYTVS
jgi:flagellar protein FlaF